MSNGEQASQDLHPIKLIACDEEQPTIQLKSGMRFAVVSVSVVQPNLTEIAAIGARLCGGSGTCLAMMEIGADVINPSPVRG